MSGGRLGTLADGLRHLRRTPDLAAMRAARSPDELARLALVPAARNLGIAAGFLPADLRTEATAALLACRVLDAYEDLSDRPLAAGAVVTAVDYLNGDTDTPPPPLHGDRRPRQRSGRPGAGRAHPRRAGAAVGTALRRPRTGRPNAGRCRPGDGAATWIRPLPRTAYGEGVLGRVVLYVCSLVAEDACAEADLSELAGCIGVTAQLANDLRDGELALYGAGDREELTRAVMLRAAGPRAGRLRPAGPARPVHPQSRRPGGDGLYDHHDDRVPVRGRRSARTLPAAAAAGRGSAGRPFTRSLDHDAGAGAAFRRRGDPPAARCVARPVSRGGRRCRVGPGCGGPRSG